MLPTQTDENQERTNHLKTTSLLTNLRSRAKQVSACLIILVGLTVLEQEATAQTATVNLGTAGDFAVLGGAGITVAGAVNTTTITGDIGTFPTTSITGLGNVVLNGVNHAGDTVTQIAQSDLVTAYNDAAGRSASTTFAPAFDLGGLTLVSGVYNDPSSFAITGVLTLDAQGNADAVWIFQAGSTLVTASNSSVSIVNGGQACHVFWQVGSSATLGTNSNFSGNVLALTSITANTGATVIGRLLARNGAVTLDTNTITEAICAVLLAPPSTTGGQGDTTSAISREELKLALILSAQVADLNTAPGLTSIYTLGFSQFNTEVFSVQQRFADMRAGSGAVERLQSGVPETRDIGSPTAMPSGKNPIGSKNPRSSKNPRGGKSYWAGKNGEGVQPVQVQLEDDDRWGFFITGTGDFVTLGDEDGTSVGTTLGLDYRLNDHWVVGVSIGYARSEIDLFDDGKIESDGVKAALYAMYQNGGFFTEALVGGGYNSYDTKRSAFLGNAQGDTNGMQFDAYLGMGYDLHCGNWTVTPMASLLYTLVGIDGFDEVGSLVPLKVESQNASSLRLRLGPRFAYTTNVGAAQVTPSFSAQWQHEFMDDELPLDARFSNNPDNLFTVYGPRVGRDSLLLTAGLNIAWSRYAAYFAYQADLGRENYENQTALIGFRVSW
jgi:uncharacterized protein YhjY with autotransporter beta-barrel domain